MTHNRHVTNGSYEQTNVWARQGGRQSFLLVRDKPPSREFALSLVSKYSHSNSFRVSSLVVNSARFSSYYSQQHHKRLIKCSAEMWMHSSVDFSGLWAQEDCWKVEDEGRGGAARQAYCGWFLVTLSCVLETSTFSSRCPQTNSSLNSFCLRWTCSPVCSV